MSKQAYADENCAICNLPCDEYATDGECVHIDCDDACGAGSPACLVHCPTRTATKKIVRIECVRETDTHADLSYLGEYSTKPGDADVTIDR